ncbi:MAG: restriction endonuclease subunit S [Candidatus Scalinduaceae bacterium]
MSKRNENKKGNKKTKVGWIPEEWECLHLKSVCLNSGEYGANAPAIPFSHNHPRYVRITDITEDGNLKTDNMKSIESTRSEGFILNSGDFLFARSGATVGKTYLHIANNQKYAFAGYLIRFIPNPKKINGSYLKAFTTSSRYWYWVQTTIRAGAQPNVNATEYSSLIIPLPPLPEQKKIADIISAWDRAIEQVSRLINAKTKLKKALMQQLFTGKRRFKEFNHETHEIHKKKKKGKLPERWQKMKLHDFLKHVSRPVPRPDKEYLALGIRSHGKGTFLRTVGNPDEVMMDTLFEVRENDLIVNITFAWEGAIAIVKKTDEGALVSHRFPTHVFKRDKVIPEYFRHVIRTKWFVHQLGLISPGGAGRNRVMSKRNFLSLAVSIPHVDEQKKIAAVLNRFDKEISLLGNQLSALKEQKTGLMQKLLTGQVRVKV